MSNRHEEELQKYRSMMVEKEEQIASLKEQRKNLKDAYVLSEKYYETMKAEGEFYKHKLAQRVSSADMNRFENELGQIHSQIDSKGESS